VVSHNMWGKTVVVQGHRRTHLGAEFDSAMPLGARRFASSNPDAMHGKASKAPQFTWLCDTTSI
jgi:hypothetical protein